MAHFAKLNNNIVENVIVVSNEICGEPTVVFPATEQIGQTFISNTLCLDGVWKQTSYNGSFRKQYAGIGYTYDADADVFVAPQPYPSWSLDENHDWQPPVPMPEGDEDTSYYWSEDDMAWLEIFAG